MGLGDALYEVDQVAVFKIRYKVLKHLVWDLRVRSRLSGGSVARTLRRVVWRSLQESSAAASREWQDRYFCAVLTKLDVDRWDRWLVRRFFDLIQCHVHPFFCGFCRQKSHVQAVRGCDDTNDSHARQRRNHLDLVHLGRCECGQTYRGDAHKSHAEVTPWNLERSLPIRFCHAETP